VTEPFGSHLREKIGNEAIAEKFLFQELYDSTLTVARQLPEKNKFHISGEYRAASRSEISLNPILLRNDQETQLRNLNGYAAGSTHAQSGYLTFSHNFYWDRRFNLTWNLTPNLNVSFRSGSQATAAAYPIDDPADQSESRIQNTHRPAGL